MTDIEKLKENLKTANKEYKAEEHLFVTTITYDGISRTYYYNFDTRTGRVLSMGSRRRRQDE